MEDNGTEHVKIHIKDLEAREMRKTEKRHAPGADKIPKLTQGPNKPDAETHKEKSKVLGEKFFSISIADLGDIEDIYLTNETFDPTCNIAKEFTKTMFGRHCGSSHHGKRQEMTHSQQHF